MCLLDFFFSSRRRHTRWNCDWSSDVCSSDLDRPVKFPGPKILSFAFDLPLRQNRTERIRNLVCQIAAHRQAPFKNRETRMKLRNQIIVGKPDKDRKSVV